MSDNNHNTQNDIEVGEEISNRNEHVNRINPQGKLPTRKLCWCRILAVLCIGSIGLNSVSIGLHQSVVVYITAIVAFFCVIIVTKNELKLRKLGTLRNKIDDCKDQVKSLQNENKKLTGTVHKLDDKVDDLRIVEKELNVILGKQDINIDALGNLVHENKVLVEEMKCIAKADFREVVLTTILRSDRDNDLSISERELNELVFRLKLLESRKFDEKKLRNFLTRSNRSVGTLIEFLRLTDKDDELVQVELDTISESFRRNTSV
mmetsp:Transcript_19280/g.27125  ORF Transcript_19280/g.27125 Transcript_19280/m.27125 type:complete len:263 (-) Transcript_19280:152-940(-)